MFKLLNNCKDLGGIVLGPQLSSSAKDLVL